MKSETPITPKTEIKAEPITKMKKCRQQMCMVLISKDAPLFCPNHNILNEHYLLLSEFRRYVNGNYKTKLSDYEIQDFLSKSHEK